MISKFNIMKYLEVFYKEDTDFCKKEDDKYYFNISYLNRKTEIIFKEVVMKMIDCHLFLL